MGAGHRGRLPGQRREGLGHGLQRGILRRRIGFPHRRIKSLKWFGTLRGRLGWLRDRSRHAVRHRRSRLRPPEDRTSAAVINGIGNALAASSSSTQVGWTAGAGVEGAIDRNWTVKLEYLYMDLGDFGNGSSSATFVTNQLNTPAARPEHGDDDDLHQFGLDQVHRPHPARRRELSLLIAAATFFSERPAQAGLSFWPKRNGAWLNRHRASAPYLSMIFFGKPVPTFPDHALARHAAAPDQPALRAMRRGQIGAPPGKVSATMAA